MSIEEDHPTTSPITSTKEWKKSSGAEAAPITVPSGNVALVRNPGMKLFLKEGMIPNSLLTIVQTSIDANQGKTMANVQQDLKANATPEQMQDILKLMDAVTIYCVVEPKVAPVPLVGEERDEDILYVDEVDLEDKMFIMQYAVGGTKDLERFRVELASVVEPTGQGEIVARASKRVTGVAPTRRTGKR